MPVVKKIFTGGINSDDASYLVDPKEYLGALNIRFITSENGNVGSITNIEGNQLKNQTTNYTGGTIAFSLPPYGYNRTIGSYEDCSRRRLVWFNYNSTGWHGIYCYDADTDLIYTLFEQPNNGTSLLFQQDRFIHSIAMSDNLLYWTDGYNEPKRLNVEAAIKANHPSYSTSVNRYEIFKPLIYNAGSGYTNGIYVNVPVSAVASPNPSWIGVGARATITVAGGVVTKVVMTYFGRYYRDGDEFTVAAAQIGGTGSGLVIKINGMLDQSVFTLIRYKPMFPLVATPVNQISPAVIHNLVDNDSFQFTYRYVYRDGERSVFAPLSNMIEYYNPSYNIYNSIDVLHPNQPIQQDVLKVEFAVKFMTGGKVFIIKTFKQADIDAHNAGSYLTYRFYNDTVGAAVASAESAKAFDYVPVKSQTLEIAKNRLFLGNNIYGYDNPPSSSISATAPPITIGSTTGIWVELEFLKNGIVYKKYYVGIAGAVSGYTYYYPNIPPAPPAFPATINFTTDITAFPGGASTAEAIAAYEGGTVISFKYTGYSANVTNAGAGATAGGTVFKSGSFYNIGVVFYDKAGRKSGVMTSPSAKAVTADIAYTNSTYSREIMWSLSNTNAISEIPDWAWYYSIVRTKCLSVSSFLQWRGGMVYIQKDPNTGDYTTSNSHGGTAFGIGIDATNLSLYEMGYTYKEDDIVRLYRSTGGTPYILNVKGVFGKYIIIDPIDFGSASGLNNLYELSTPYVNTEEEFYYEVGPTLRVSNPTSSFRSYETTYGFLKGDTYIKSRNISPTPLYYTENMSLSDTFWQNWYTGIGMANIILNNGRSIMPVSISYSNNYMPGTQINGLSTFDALDSVNMPVELESIQRLIITSKVQTEGSVMLAIGEQETANVYIGETQIFDNTGSSFLATSSGVIGNISVLRGSFGTINPESAFEWSGEVLYFDANRGSWVRYNTNGLYPISDNKARKMFKRIGMDIINNKKDPSVYNAVNTNLPIRVLGMVDPYHEEYLIAMPRMGVIPRNAVLDDVELNTYSYGFTMVAASLEGTPNSLSSFTYQFGAGPSANQSFVVSGSNLSPNGSVVITAPSDYEIGTSVSSFSQTITLPYTGTGTFAVNTIYVRLKAGLSTGSHAGNITLVGGGASSTVSLSGSVTVPAGATLNATPSSTNILNYVEASGPSTAVQISLTGFNLSPASGNITIPSTTNIQVSTTSATAGFSTAGTTIAYTGGALPSTSIWVRLKSGLSIGNYSENIVISGGGATTTVTASGNVTDWDIITIVSAGLGNTVLQACSTQGSYSLITPYTGGAFGPGSVVFYSGITPTQVTGYSFIHAFGSIWNMDPLTGTILSLSTTQC